MWFSYFIALIFLLSAAMARRDGYRPRERMPDEADDIYYGKNGSHVPTTTGKPKGEAVVEKFVETLMASEKYLKLVETVERKLNHLDATFHERSNSILKYLSELMRMIKASPSSMLEASLKSLKYDLDKLKTSVLEKIDLPKMRGANLLGNSECFILVTKGFH